jgi:DNA polymerase-3 subunit delta'
MRAPITHPRTEKSLLSLLAQPPHALVIIGPAGSGKTHIANYYIETILSQDKLTQSQHEFHTIRISPNKRGTISIDEIRDLYGATKTKLTSRKLVVIENAQNMSKQAQNAFLKLLEEPPDKVLFVLTLDNINHLLPTIRSRVQALTIYAPSAEQAIKQIKELLPKYSESLIQQNFLKAGGLIGKTIEYLTTESPQAQSIEAAKQLLAASPSERFIKAQTIMSEREQTIAVLEGLLTICSIALKSAANRGDKAAVKSWATRIETVQTSLSRISNRASHKLQLLNTLFNL